MATVAAVVQPGLLGRDPPALGCVRTTAGMQCFKVPQRLTAVTDAPCAGTETHTSTEHSGGLFQAIKKSVAGGHHE